MTLSLGDRVSAIIFRDPGTFLALIWIFLGFVNARILQIRAHISVEYVSPSLFRYGPTLLLSEEMRTL